MSTRSQFDDNVSDIFFDMHQEIILYNLRFESIDLNICDHLANMIDDVLKEAESKIWHAHPVWFLDGNPIVGYSKQKKGIRLMFWSGADFEENCLNVLGLKFKDASIFFNHSEEIDDDTIKRCLEKSIDIQWDYKNIVKRKGQLIRLK